MLRSIKTVRVYAKLLVVFSFKLFSFSYHFRSYILHIQYDHIPIRIYGIYDIIFLILPTITVFLIRLISRGKFFSLCIKSANYFSFDPLLYIIQFQMHILLLTAKDHRFAMTLCSPPDSLIHYTMCSIQYSSNFFIIMIFDPAPRHLCNIRSGIPL